MIDNNDLVSIIMPAYNVEKYISDSINSVLNQTYTDWELIIVDDNSSDNTNREVLKYNDKRIILLRNDKNSGAAISRNKALSVAQGKWIAFLDGDDLWEPTKLEKQINYMYKNKYSFTYTNYSKIDEDGNELCILCSGPKVVTKEKMYNYAYPGCLTVMYDRKVIGNIQIKDIKKNNDYAMWLKVVKKANCYLLDENLAKYRIRKQSISHDKLLKKIKSHYDLYRICDEKGFISSFLHTINNLFHGVIKKMIYEQKY